MADSAIPSQLPNDEVLAATKARLEKLLAPQVERGGLEAMDSALAPEPPKSAKERARERLLANPREAVVGRLRKKGITETPRESGLETIGVGAPAFPESAKLSETDIARGLERIIGRNELLGVQYLDGGLAAARSVGRIVVRLSPSRTAPMGTGFLIAPGLLMTNNHVLPTDQSARGGVVQFNYQCGLDGNMLVAVSFALEPDVFFHTSKSTELDFTLVAVRETADNGANLADFGFKRLAVLSNEVLAGESVTIVQHPNGEPKQIALRENFVLALPGVKDRYLYYQTDTTPGSSGSPVFNDEWEVVALHHSGYAKRNDEGKLLARDGRVWSESMGEDEIAWIANEGIRVAAILGYLGSVAGLDDAKQRILKQALAEAANVAIAPTPAPVEATQPTPEENVPSPPDRQANPPANEPSGHAISVPPISTAPILAGSEIVFTVPLQISVRLGTTQAVAPVAPAAIPEAVLEKIEIDTDYADREGYNPAFLGGGSRRVPLPQLSKKLLKDAAQNLESGDGTDGIEIPYHHYSVVLNAKRRVAFFTAVNIDGTLQQKLEKREQDRWIFDRRVESRFQIGNEWYAKPFDRGHLVRRLDPAWGRTKAIAKTANDDTFHFTNCSPQHAKLNEGKRLWQGLENYLLDTANQEERRITVFTGPIFRPDDPTYDGVQVPKEFWKVAAWVRPDGSMGAAGFIVSQEELLRQMGLEAMAEQVARTFQTGIRKIEDLTKLDFGSLRNFDTFQRGAAPLEAVEAETAELDSLEQIQL